MRGFVTYDATKKPNELTRYTKDPTLHVRLYANDIPENTPEDLVSDPRSMENLLKALDKPYYDKVFGVNKDLYDFLNRDVGAIEELFGPIDWSTNAIYRTDSKGEPKSYDSYDYKPDIVKTQYGDYDYGKRKVDRIADKFRNIFLDSHDFSPLMGPELEERTTPFIFDPNDYRTADAKKQMLEGKKWYEVSPMPEKLYGYQFAKAPDVQWAKFSHPIEHPAYNMNHPAWLDMESKMPTKEFESAAFHKYTPDAGVGLPDVSQYIGKSAIPIFSDEGIDPADIIEKDGNKYHFKYPGTIGTTIKGIKHVNEDATEPDVKPGEEIIITKDGKYIKLDPETNRYVPVNMKPVKLPGVPQWTDITIPNGIGSENVEEFSTDITEEIFNNPSKLEQFLKEHGVKGHGIVPKHADMWTGKTVVDTDGNPKPYDYIAGLLRRRRREDGDFLKPEEVHQLYADAGVQNAYIDNLLKTGYSLDELARLGKMFDESPVEASNALGTEIKKYLNWIKHHKWKKLDTTVRSPERMKDKDGNDIFKIVEKPKLNEKGEQIIGEDGKPVMKKVKVYVHKKLPQFMLDADDQQIRSRGMENPLERAPRKVSKAAKAMRALKKALSLAKMQSDKWNDMINNPPELTEADLLKNYETKEKMMEELGPKHFDRLTGQIKYTPQMVLQEMIDSINSGIEGPEYGNIGHSRDDKIINAMSKADKYKKWIDMLDKYESMGSDIKEMRKKINAADIDNPDIFTNIRQAKQKRDALRKAIRKAGVPMFFLTNPNAGGKLHGQALDNLGRDILSGKTKGRNKQGEMVDKSHKELNRDRRQRIKNMFKDDDPKRVAEIMEWFNSTADEEAGIPALTRTPDNMYLFNELFPLDFWEDQVAEGKGAKDILKSMFPIYKSINAKNPELIKKLRKLANERAARTQVKSGQRNIANTLAGLNMHNN